MSGPITLQGFDLPASTTATTSASNTTSGMYSIDPSFVYDFTSSDSAASTSSHRPAAAHQYHLSQGISDLDLDFEATLASLQQHTVNSNDHLQQDNTPSNGAPALNSHHQPHFGSSAGLYDPSTMNSNAFDLFGFNKIQHSATGGSFQSPLDHHGASTDLGALPHFLAQTSAVPSPASLAAMATIPAQAQPQQQPTRSPHVPDNHSPNLSSGPQAIDPFGVHAAQPPPSTSSQQDSPREFGSFSSAGTDSFASLTATSQPNNGPGNPTRRKQSPPDAPVERGRAASRRRSDHVGKAPSNSARSRSARRQAAQYQSMGTGGAAAQASAAAAAAAQREAQAVGNTVGPSGSPGSAPGSGTIPSSPASAVSIPSNLNASAAANGQQWYGSQQQPAAAYSQTSEYESGSLENPGWAESNTPGHKKERQLDDVPEDPKQAAALLTEKRRKRRESHNAVERRRRDNINDRITELASLLPEVLLEQAANTKEDDYGPGGSPSAGVNNSPMPNLLALPPLGTNARTTTPLFGAHMAQGAGAQAVAAAKPNKGVILAKSVEYIRYLQQLVELQAQRSSELERMVRELHGSNSRNPSQTRPHRTDSTTSFDAASINGSGPGTGASTSDARSPTDTRDMTASISSSQFGDPNYNENFINAAGQDFGSDSPWGNLTIPKQEDMDET